MKTIFITLLVLVLLVGTAFLVIGNELTKMIFPWKAGVEFNYDMEPVERKLGSEKVGFVTFNIPKAYFYGVRIDSPIKMRASWKDDLKPWTLSESFKNRDKSAMMYINIHGKAIESYTKTFPHKKLKDMFKRVKRKYPERFHEVDQGVYKDIFHRYHSLTSIIKPNIMSGIGAVLLVPIIETEKPYSISCGGTMHPTHFCTVEAFTEDNVRYQFKIRTHEIENFLERDRQVEELINKLIMKEIK